MQKTQIIANKREYANNKILEKELSYQVVGCFYNVANLYGQGFKESLYQKVLCEEFLKQKIKFEEQKRINIYSLETGNKIGTYIPDFLVENKIIVEIKAMSFTLDSSVNQQISYLKASRFEVAYLVNFGTPRLFIKRTVYSNERKPFVAVMTQV